MTRPAEHQILLRVHEPCNPSPPALLGGAGLTTLVGETVVFEGRFETRPDAGWRWLREDAAD